MRESEGRAGRGEEGEMNQAEGEERQTAERRDSYTLHIV